MVDILLIVDVAQQMHTLMKDSQQIQLIQQHNMLVSNDRNNSSVVLSYMRICKAEPDVSVSTDNWLIHTNDGSGIQKNSTLQAVFQKFVFQVG